LLPPAERQRQSDGVLDGGGESPVDDVEREERGGKQSPRQLVDASRRPSTVRLAVARLMTRLLMLPQATADGRHQRRRRPLGLSVTIGRASSARRPRRRVQLSNTDQSINHGVMPEFWHRWQLQHRSHYVFA